MSALPSGRPYPCPGATLSRHRPTAFEAQAIPVGRSAHRGRSAHDVGEVPVGCLPSVAGIGRWTPEPPPSEGSPREGNRMDQHSYEHGWAYAPARRPRRQRRGLRAFAALCFLFAFTVGTATLLAVANQAKTLPTTDGSTDGSETASPSEAGTEESASSSPSPMASPEPVTQDE